MSPPCLESQGCHLMYKCFKSGIDKLTEWSTIPECPSLICALFNRGDTEATDSSKILCLMFVYFFVFCGLCQD